MEIGGGRKSEGGERRERVRERAKQKEEERKKKNFVTIQAALLHFPLLFFFFSLSSAAFTRSFARAFSSLPFKQQKQQPWAPADTPRPLRPRQSWPRAAPRARETSASSTRPSRFCARTSSASACSRECWEGVAGAFFDPERESRAPS